MNELELFKDFILKDFLLNPVTNFTFFDLTDSDSYSGLVLENRIHAIKNPWLIINLSVVCREILDPLSERIDPFGDNPDIIFINSGGRFHKLNYAVGGKEHSEHLLFSAVDFYSNEFSIDVLGQEILMGELPFHQLIFNYEEKKPFLHISKYNLNPQVENYEILKKENGKYVSYNFK